MINKILKKAKYIAGVSLLATSLVLLPPGNAKADESFGVRPFADFGLEIKAGGSVGKVNNVPESVRYVPIHKKDSFVPIKNNAPIPKDSAKVFPMTELNFIKLGIESDLGKGFYLDLYGNASLNLSSKEKLELKDINERDYERNPGSSERGYGTALTYWGTKYKSIFLPGLKADLYIPLEEENYEHEKQGAYLLLGTGLRKYTIQSETGWDRWNSLEKYKCHDLGDVIEKSLSLGLFAKFTEKRDNWNKNNPLKGMLLGLRYGINFNDFKGKEKKTDITKKTSSFGAFEFYLRF
jgi:hypothetical protein